MGRNHDDGDAARNDALPDRPALRDLDDNPEWTRGDFARARPAGEVHPPHVVKALVSRNA